MLFHEITALCDAGDEKDLLGLKLVQFSRTATQPAVADEAIRLGGVHTMVVIVKRANKHQSLALKILLAFLSRPEGLTAMDAERGELFRILYASLYSASPAIVTLSMGLFRVMVEYYDDSLELVGALAKEFSCSRNEVEYAVIVEKLTRGFPAVVHAATRVFITLISKSVAVATTEALMSVLRNAGLLAGLETARKTIPAELTDLRSDLDRLVVLCGSQGDVRKNMEKTNWQSEQFAESVFKASSPGLVSKVSALANLAELAGVTTDEGMIMQVLTQHLKQMEEKLLSMSKEQQEEATKAMEKQQLAMDLQMAEQKKLYEQKLYELQNDTRLEEVEKNNATLALQIEELKANQATLVQEYSKNQDDISEQNYLRQHKQLWLFYQCIQMKLNELFLGYKVLATGMIQAQDLSTKTQRGIATAITIAGDLIPFPGATTAATLVTGLMRLYKNRKTCMKTDKISTTAVSVSSMEQISESCARVLTLRYENQIRALEDQGAKLLGECAVRRMMEAMRVGCLDILDNTVDNKAIAKQLVEVIVTVDKRQGIVGIKHMSIPTLTSTNLRWNEQAIFKKPGIRTLEGEFYHSPPETDVAAYGYRLGTAEEAKELHYLKCRRHATSLDPHAAINMSFHASTPIKPSLTTSTSFTPPPPYKSPALGPSPSASVQFFATPATTSPSMSVHFDNSTTEASIDEVAELRKLVAAQAEMLNAQQNTLASVLKRLEQAESLLLQMSARVFPK